LISRDTEKELQQKEFQCMGLVVDGKVIGMAFFKEFHLIEFMIHPSERRKGYGSKFIQRLGAIEDNHFHIIESTAESLPFYQKRGYHTILGITRGEKVEYVIMKHILPEHRQLSSNNIKMVQMQHPALL
jgi:GNAT superfamily N-acetyltransferase